MAGAADDRTGNDPAAERDFYLGLLDLVAAAEPEPLLIQALAMIVAASGARIAYIELRDLENGPDSTAPRYWKAHGCTEEELASIRESMSRGIIARTLAEGRTIATPSAIADPSFRDQPSVLRNAIQAVLCAPIGQPPFGVIYLQGLQAGNGFTIRNRSAVEVFARQLGMVADRLLSRQRRYSQSDATAEIRRQFKCPGIVGRSEALAHVLHEAAQVAPPSITVLLTGPTGTGKSALARAIAANSSRATGPYIDLNCAALPESLLEGELFGAEPGAYTGATKRTPGKVAAARSGTLFLDEVAELSLTAQAKLLQLLQERHYYPLGATTPVPADVRVISATNVDLKARVAQKKFREDLFYRLAVVTIEMPTLEQRREDIPELVERFCQDFCQRNQLRLLRPTRRALIACREASWPGNIRELTNAVEAAIARASFARSETLDEHHIFPTAERSSEYPTLREATQRSQRRIIDEALTRNEWNITRTAVELDVSRQHLHDLISSFGLRRPDSAG